MIPDGYHLAELAPEHAPGLATAYARNREHLTPWDPERSDEFYTVAGQEAAVAGQLASVGRGLMHAWVLTHGDEVVGRVNLNNVVMGVFRTAALGYWVDAGHLRRGLAAAMVEQACAWARGLGLHRVEAGTMVHNAASQRVLEKCGFVRFGLAPEYLFLAGAWQDHVLFQRILHQDPL